MEKLRAFISLILNSKLKILFFLLSFIIFIILIFPFDDLGDFASSQIAKMTNNSVFVQFDHLKIGFFPTGIKLEEVYIDANSLSGLYTKELTVLPSLAALINQKPFGQIHAKGFFKGDVQVDVSQGQRGEGNKERLKIDIDANKISFTELKKTFNIPYNLSGSIDLQAEAQVEPTMADQPEVKFDLNIKKLDVPQITLNTEMGAITLPELSFTRVDIKGRLAGGKIYFDVINLGEDVNELHGSVKGNMALALNSNLQPQFSNYSFDLDLRAKNSFLNKAGWILAPLENYKYKLANGSQFKFKVSGMNFYGPPSISALR